MFITSGFTDYKILDCGDNEKLEVWGDYILARPDPQAIWRREKPKLWSTAHAHYYRSTTGGGEWKFSKKLPDRWGIAYGELKFFVRPTGFKHTGLFPEQGANWDFMQKQIANANRNISVLNLFAYTGGATLACANAGACVTHVDSAKSMVLWAKENAKLSNLEDANIRYIIDDCLKFVLREQRRGVQYDAIIMDPPSYGRGADGQVWKMEKDLFSLVCECAKLLSDNPLFFLINSYTTGLSGVVTKNMLELTVSSKFSGKTTAADLVLPVEHSKLLLPCGSSARWFYENII